MALGKIGRVGLLAHRYEDVPPGLPLRSIVISNTERGLLACPRKYLLAVIEGLKPIRTGAPRSYGQHFHRVKEAVHRAWIEDRAPTPEEIEASLQAVRDGLKRDVQNGAVTFEEAQDIRERVEGNISAWLRLHGGGEPPKSMRLIACEIPMAMPILGPNGKPFAPKSMLVPDGSGYRLARPGDDRSKAISVRWPWYFVGRLDSLLVHRTTRTVWVSDDKTTKSIDSLLRKLTNDPQVPSYLALVRYNVRQGLLRSIGIEPGDEVGGFWHRVTSSSGFSPPKQLKDGSLSVAKNARTLSWAYEEKVKELGLDPAEYADHIASLRERVDGSIEDTKWIGYGGDELNRFERELYGDAVRAHSLWSSAFGAQYVEDLDVTHPRVRICQASNFPCDLVGPCMRDGNEVRTDFNVQAWQTWQPLSKEQERAAKKKIGKPLDLQPLLLPAPSATLNGPEEPNPVDDLGW